MATSILVNKLGDRRFTHYLPSTAQNAQDFAALLDGEWDIYEKVGSSGNDQVSGEYQHATIMIQDNTTKKKAYFRVYIKNTVSEDDITTALKGKTYNGVKADTVYVLNLSWVGTPSQNSGSGGGNG